MTIEMTHNPSTIMSNQTRIITTKYPPHIDLTRAPLAYGDRALPRLNNELMSGDLITIQRAINSLSEYLHDSEHIFDAVKNAGIMLTLKDLLTHSDILIRTKVTECLHTMAGHTIGRDAFCQHSLIEPLALLLDDTELLVRINTHATLLSVSFTAAGVEGMIKAQLVSKLVAKLVVEVPEIKILILDTLNFCLKCNTHDALNSDAMGVFTSLLQTGSDEIQWRAASCIMALSVPLEGKDSAVQMNTVELLVRLLSSAHETVQAKCAGAIMMISITTKGKFTSMAANAIPPMLILLKSDNTEVQANVLKTLTCLAETVDGRKTLLTHVDLIKTFTDSPVPAVVKCAFIALKVITWLP